MKQLDRYLVRIGIEGVPAPDIVGLRAIIARHVATFPFETLDIYLGKAPGIDTDRAFTKMVDRKRGGWCYEQNGLLGMMLDRIDFSVIRLSCAVQNHRPSGGLPGSHLALLISLDRPYLVDVGFGGSLTHPLPLVTGIWSDGPFEISLEDLGGAGWRFTERLAWRDPFGFDFRAEPADEQELARMREWQANDEASPFVRRLTVQRRDGDRHLSLRGRSLTDYWPDRVRIRHIETAGELVSVLEREFELELPELLRTRLPEFCAPAREN